MCRSSPAKQPYYYCIDILYRYLKQPARSIHQPSLQGLGLADHVDVVRSRWDCIEEVH